MELKEIARNVRIGIIKGVHAAQSGHPGGSLSAADILTYLYFKELNIDPKNPKDELRDRFVLSKGHTSPLLYAVLAERGYFSKDSLTSFRKIGSKLQGHPDMNKVPGVDMSTGSLGLGVCTAVGMALAGKVDNKSYRVYTLLGDGEIEEGSVWEASMAAAHYNLDNLVVMVDNNNLQIDGEIGEVMSPYPIDEKFKAFGFNVINVDDGHDFEKIEDAFKKARVSNGKPTAIIFKTIKGKGVSFMENQVSWHGSAPNDEQAKQALKELGGEM